ncbi:hypothetical protein GVN24_19990 [Rhizobium sp. CRIBSB]|nr:hypothetical protein [Rhizobium sp. CRIBSB]
MKRGQLVCGAAMFAIMAGCATAQDRVEDPYLAGAPSPEALGVAQAVTAAELAAWGRRNSDPGALIMAARLLDEVPLRAGEDAGEAFLTPSRLLDEAEALSQGHPAWLDAIGQLRESGVRGVRTSPFGQGPIFTVKDIQARGTYGFEVEARAGEVLRVAAIGDGDTDIDMAVRDARGSLVCQDGFGDHYPVCTVPMRSAGRMRIDIVNRGAVWTKVQILSN